MRPTKTRRVLYDNRAISPVELVTTSVPTMAEDNFVALPPEPMAQPLSEAEMLEAEDRARRGETN